MSLVLWQTATFSSWKWSFKFTNVTISHVFSEIRSHICPPEEAGRTFKKVFSHSCIATFYWNKQSDYFIHSWFQCCLRQETAPSRLSLGLSCLYCKSYTVLLLIWCFSSNRICILYTIKPSEIHIYSNHAQPCEALGYSVWLEEIVNVDTWGLCLPFSTGPDYARFWVTRTHRKWLTSGPRRLHATTSSFTSSLSLKPSALSCRLWVSWSFRVICIVCFVFLWCDFIVWLSGVFSHISGNVLHVSASCPTFPPFFCFAWLIRFIFNSFHF